MEAKPAQRNSVPEYSHNEYKAKEKRRMARKRPSNESDKLQWWADKSRKSLVDFMMFATQSRGELQRKPLGHLLYLEELILDQLFCGLSRVGTIVSMPPRHGKSELISICLPIWACLFYPGTDVIVVSYGQDFVEQNIAMRAKREYVESEAFQYMAKMMGMNMEPSVNSAAAIEFGGKNRGDVKSTITYTSLSGPITGRGAQIIIIDDPYKNAEQANSEQTRGQIYENFASSAMTRITVPPGGKKDIKKRPMGVFIVQTRWHPEDLAGSLTDVKSDNYNKEIARQFHSVNLPLLSKKNSDKLIAAEIHDLAKPIEHWHKHLRFLSDDRVSENALHAMFNIDNMSFLAQQQGMPTIDRGDMFSRDVLMNTRWQTMPSQAILEESYVFATSDHAQTQNARSDYTVMLVCAAHKPTGMLYVLEINRGRWLPTQQAQKMLEICERNQGAMEIRRWFFENEAIGRGIMDSVKVLSTEKGVILPPLQGMSVHKGKELRINALASIASQSRFRLPKGNQQSLVVISELCEFPNGRHDDALIAASIAASVAVKVTANKKPEFAQPVQTYVNPLWEMINNPKPVFDDELMLPAARAAQHAMNRS